MHLAPSTATTSAGKMRRASTIIVCCGFAFHEWFMRSDVVTDGHSLPASLHSWLFPSDGTTRDFETLQVTLLHDDEFCASDKNDKIASERRTHESLHRRSAPDRFMIRVGHTAAEQDSPELTRRQTYTTPGETATTSRRTRSVASVPFTRSWSLLPTPVQPLPRAPSPSATAVDTGAELPRTLSPGKPLEVRYSDASTQTSAAGLILPDPSRIIRGHRHARSQLQCYPGHSYIANVNRGNPVRIGSMSAYFRSPGFQLGDAML